MLLVSTGRDGRGHGRERTAVTTRPGEWRQVARWSGWLPPFSGFRALFSFPAVGWTPGWVGRCFCGRSGRSVLLGPRAVCASPLLADNFAALPAACIITSEYDPLRDEGKNYAERLSAAGVKVCLKRYDGIIHGFFNMQGTL